MVGMREINSVEMARVEGGWGPLVAWGVRAAYRVASSPRVQSFAAKNVRQISEGIAKLFG